MQGLVRGVLNGKSETVQSGSKSSINQIHKLGHIRASSNLIIRIRLSVVVVVVVLASALGGGSITLELGAARIARLHKKGQQLPLSVFALPPPPPLGIVGSRYCAGQALALAAHVHICALCTEVGDDCYHRRCIAGSRTTSRCVERSAGGTRGSKWWSVSVALAILVPLPGWRVEFVGGRSGSLRICFNLCRSCVCT